MKNLKKLFTDFAPLLAVVAVITVPLGLWLLKCHLEASAFNRLTGKHATAWDAMWVQLRVQQ